MFPVCFACKFGWRYISTDSIGFGQLLDQPTTAQASSRMLVGQELQVWRKNHLFRAWIIEIIALGLEPELKTKQLDTLYFASVLVDIWFAIRADRKYLSQNSIQSSIRKGQKNSAYRWANQLRCLESTK